jgi:hypothetical protein
MERMSGTALFPGRKKLSKGSCFRLDRIQKATSISIYHLNLARVGGFHLQGMEGRSHSELLQALANAADGSLRLARRVKIKEKK